MHNELYHCLSENQSDHTFMKMTGQEKNMIKKEKLGEEGGREHENIIGNLHLWVPGWVHSLDDNTPKFLRLSRIHSKA